MFWTYFWAFFFAMLAVKIISHIIVMLIERREKYNSEHADELIRSAAKKAIAEKRKAGSIL